MVPRSHLITAVTAALIGGAVGFGASTLHPVSASPTPVRAAVGPQGPAGPQGAPGLKGDPGAQGAPGVAGPQGAAGANGAPGSTGATGSTGVTVAYYYVGAGFHVCAVDIYGGRYEMKVGGDGTIVADKSTVNPPSCVTGP